MARFVRVLAILAPLLPVAGGLALSFALPSGAAGASVYKFIDEKGVVHFSDKRHDDRYAWHAVSRNEMIAREQLRQRQVAPVQDSFDELILQAASRFRLQPALVKAVIAAESNFEPRAVSRAGAQGLMQLMPFTAEAVGVQDPFHPEQNVHGGTRYLRRMLDRYGDVRRALAAYNAGPEAVDRYNGIPPYRETRAYVTRVLNYYRGYHDEFRRRGTLVRRKLSSRTSGGGR